MKNIILLILVSFTFQSASAQTGNEILPVLRERVDVGKTNQSIVVAVIDKTGIRFTSYGKTSRASGAKDSDENTIFEIGSITKVFTGTLLAEAVRRGEVKIDDPISKYLPPTVKTPTRGGKEITLLDLATQSSGLPRMPTNFAPKNPQNPYADYTVEQMYGFLSKYELPRLPGAKYEYSNLGMGLLGHILSLRAKMSYEDLVKTRILIPLKMKDTSIALSPAQKMRTAQGFDESDEEISLWDLPTLAGAGALRSTAKDMAKFIAANLNLEKSSLAPDFAAAQKPQREAANNSMKIGLAWHILQKPDEEIVWHNGGTGGFRSFIGFIRDQKRGVVVLTNSFNSIDDIGMHILDERLPLTKIKPFLLVNEKVLDEYVGKYEFAPNDFLFITRNGDKLFAQGSDQFRFRIFAEPGDKFYNTALSVQMTFNRAEDAKVKSVTVHQNGDQIGKKIE